FTQPALHLQEAGAGNRGVVELGNIPGRACIREAIRIAGTLDCRAGDAMGGDVVGMTIGAALVVCNHNVWPDIADQPHQPARSLMGIGSEKAVRVLVLRCSGHAGVAVAEEMELLDPEDLTGAP